VPHHEQHRHPDSHSRDVDVEQEERDEQHDHGNRERHVAIRSPPIHKAIQHTTVVLITTATQKKQLTQT
jgi:hypothetical protein